MRYFFIDLENVRNEGLEGVLTLNSDDMVYIFYSENAFSMAIPTLESITNSKCSSKFIKTNYIGKNAMDFQIVSLFGATIERCKEGSFYIISKDNGFRSAVSFCESYFGHYPIKCGVFAKIINAVSNELKPSKNKNASSVSAKPAAAQESVIPAELPAAVADTQEQQSKTRSRSRSRRRGGSKQTPETVTAAPQSGEPVRSEAVQEDEQKNAKVRNNPGQGQENAGKEQNKPGKLDYIFEVLGEILSPKTIEIYAQTIDDGVAKTANREELKAYFAEQLGDDEGDALFKVVQSDYELFKQKRPKRTSRPHRNRSKNKSKDKE
ncbi:MAG: hypothetical protein K6G81_11205 [Lachnospiraceae bacterium]|nr:hypothetical protein [Lachnospiraceae bacterium]